MAELKEIMKGSDAEILEWLKNNFDEFANSTETTQQYMIQEWQDMLNEMRGFTETYEEQIKEIMSWTDEEIIEWMTQHSIDFQNATDTARESFIYGWRETLEAWRKAFEDVTKEITDMTKIEPVVKSSSSSSSSSSKSSSSSSSSSKSSTTTTARFVASGTGSAEAYKATATTITYNGVVYVDDPHSSYWFKKSDAKSIDAGRTYYWSGKTRYVKKYASGGIADYTGLAMLDGTKSRPERILSAYQTELFEDMLSSLHSIRTMRVPSFAPIAASEYSGDGAGG